jgi:hypothetical protein
MMNSITTLFDLTARCCTLYRVINTGTRLLTSTVAQNHPWRNCELTIMSMNVGVLATRKPFCNAQHTAQALHCMPENSARPLIPDNLNSTVVGSAYPAEHLNSAHAMPSMQCD